MLQKVGLPALADGALLKADAFIDGAWVPAASGARFAVHNPADGIKLADVANAGPAEATQAIAAAGKAMPAWRGKTAKERSAPGRTTGTSQVGSTRLATSDDVRPGWTRVGLRGLKSGFSLTKVGSW